MAKVTKYIAKVDIKNDKGEMIKPNEEIINVSNKRIKWLLDGGLIISVEKPETEEIKETD